MKNLLIVIIMIFSTHVFAEESYCQELRNDNLTTEQLARRGCCSHHSGVCNCSGGRVVCCDGSFSPSCTCNKDENNNEIKIVEELKEG